MEVGILIFDPIGLPKMVFECCLSSRSRFAVLSF